MSPILVQILLILALILLNGLFAMAEIAVVSSRPLRLKVRAETGDRGAGHALSLAERPTRFLSTVQIGITLVGVFAGAYGGAAVAGPLAEWLATVPFLARYSGQIALSTVVLVITYLSLVIGELVPKRIALTNPERIAARIARPMHALSVVASPIVRLLTLSTEAVLRPFQLGRSAEPPVTEEEVAAMVAVGAEAGIFEEEEQELVERVFWLGDQKSAEIMTPRHRIVWLDRQGDPEKLRQTLIENRHSHYLVCDGEVDRVRGMVRVKDLLANLLEGRSIDLDAAMRKPLFVPDTLRGLRLLEMFRESGVHFAVVIDEYGGVEGVVTLNDVLEEITGDLTTDIDPRVVQRSDGSWLVDGSLSMDDFWESLGLVERRADVRAEYHSVGGLLVTGLGRIPRSGDHFDSGDLRFEVVDMDGNRVDKVLVTRREPPAEDQSAE